jgi:hypothetical protein
MWDVRRLLVALTVVLLTSCQNVSATVSAPLPDSCDSSPVISASIDDGSVRIFRGLFRWTSGPLAGPVDVEHTSGTKGQLWILRAQDPPRTTFFSATRIGSTTRTEFEVWRYYARDGSDRTAIQLPDGSVGFLYAATAGGAVLYESGCWRVEAGGGVVTIPVD